jgi:hypothetical protein
MENFEKSTFAKSCDPLNHETKKTKETAVEFDRLNDQISILQESIKKLEDCLEPVLGDIRPKDREENVPEELTLCRMARMTRELAIGVRQANIALDDIIKRLEI